ncbi:hypothetical protein [Nostoc sp.]
MNNQNFKKTSINLVKASLAAATLITASISPSSAQGTPGCKAMADRITAGLRSPTNNRSVTATYDSFSARIIVQFADTSKGTTDRTAEESAKSQWTPALNNLRDSFGCYAAVFFTGGGNNTSTQMLP